MRPSTPTRRATGLPPLSRALADLSGQPPKTYGALWRACASGVIAPPLFYQDGRWWLPEGKQVRVTDRLGLTGGKRGAR